MADDRAAKVPTRDWRVHRGFVGPVLALVLALVQAAPPSSAEEVTQAPTAPAREAVTLQLRWHPQFQFAGFYAALWQGYYADAGLDVRIRSGQAADGTILSPVEEVVSGRADFGIAGSNILTASDAGADLVILESIFQTTPGALYVTRPATYEGLADLRHMRLMMSQDPEMDLILAAMLEARDVPLDSLETVPWDPARLWQVDAYVGHSLGTPILLERHGFEALEVRPRHYGVDFYGDTVFTTRALAEGRTDMVERFAAASLLGWRYAIDHPDAVATRLSAEFPFMGSREATAEANRFQIGRVIDLTGHPLVEVGHINPARWQAMHTTLRKMGAVTGPFEADALIFDRARLSELRSEKMHQNMLGTLAFLAVLLLVVAIFAILLRQAVANRTRQLAESEERYRLLIDNLHGYGIYALDEGGRIVSWSASAEAIGGLRREDVIGKPYAMLFSDADRAAGLPDRILEEARAAGRREVEGWRRAKDGREFWVQSVVSAVREADGTPRGYAVITRDMTEQRRAQDRIMFQAILLNRVRAAVIATNADDRVTYMNAYAEALFLLPWREAEGKRLAALDLMPGSGTRRLERGERHEREVTARRRDGHTFPALCVTSLSADPEGTPTQIHVIHDLTDRKRMEQALQHASNLALLGRMSASLVHEISQPMNVIRLTAEGGLLRLGRGAPDVQDIEKRLRTIAGQASRLFDTIDLMQAFSRRDAAQGDAPAGRFNVGEAVAGVLRDTAERLDKAQVAVETRLPDVPQYASGRPRQFEQVVQNLITNAVQALAGQPAEAPRRLRVRLTPPDAADRPLILEVEDSGPGIPAAQREAIFEPFYTTKPAGQGTGLGLYISLALIRGMGGDLEVGESDLGGARFALRLPTVPGAPAGDRPPRPGAGAATMPMPELPAAAGPAEDNGAAHLLVVDDEALALMEISESLRDRGYRVSEARHGRAALAILRRCNGTRDGSHAEAVAPPVDAVITDIHMPGGSGADLIRALAEAYPQVFVLVMTGQPLEDRQALEDLGGADAVLRKPISLEDLDDRLEALLWAADGGEADNNA